MDSYCFNMFDNIQRFTLGWTGGEEEEEEEKLSYYSELLMHDSRRKIIKREFDTIG